MTEERDPKVSKRYRGLGREEPPRELDERILAASRRAGRAGKYRWAGPLAAAAVLVLAIGVALNVERQKPDEAVPVATAPAPPAAPPAFTPDPKPREPSREMRARPESRAAAKAPPPQAAPAPRMEDARRERAADELAQQRQQPAPGAPASSDEANAAAAVAARRDAQLESRAAQAAPQAGTRPELAKVQPSPAQWLDRIAQLRREGKHEEADRQLAEFKRAYPDYRLSDEMKAKVENR